MFCLYIIDDEVGVRNSLRQALKKICTVKTFSTVEKALKSIDEEPVDLVLLDIELPGIGGVNALKQLKQKSPGTAVIMVTANDEIPMVVSCMKQGAYDYITKPFNLKMVVRKVHNCFESLHMKKEVELLQQKYFEENLPCFIGESDSIQEVMTMVDSVAKSPAPVLILGESGTGKDLIARTIHYKSESFQKSFVALNCASIPENLIESELFGYEKGAFSGAGTKGKKGQLELAQNGTLFLDEIGDLGLDAQAKILRFLEDGGFYRLGGTKKLFVKTRIVSATNKNLEKMIAKKLFREDLYYRLALIKIRVPSLNKRRKDIIPIAKHFLIELSKNYKKKFNKISPEVEQYILKHRWKGNIRELKNFIERGVILGKGPTLNAKAVGIYKTSVPSKMHNNLLQPLPEEGMDLNALEAHYMEEAIKKSQGNDALAARLLGLSYYAFRYRKKQLKK
ncbi:sigma-54-dependent transcriptional regulator [Candidatus Uabimicrobium amorphum]|uniref:Acetoacetate metabolism regulatory protein AtoC n=1 Tax=Uabimicrobium amorphum TaxID=2596890 RepID=A0A5S9F5C9_UABAM|nr:sigma-54 dependent transcriptional regulator [Candidatus Uabimicrobium amorphum]BBM86468.1 acetoacetate metabolism regulatory protein AtoC [Candidatus Uabimicrobium amorphum]